jgi:NAD(P)-dependent dehydrogenase (short-subunit alcohol dehydrogenase family)
MTLPVGRDLSATGVRVNTVAHGLIDTPIYGEGGASEAFKAKLGESVLFPNRLGVPDELASMVVERVTNVYLNARPSALWAGSGCHPSEPGQLSGARLPPRSDGSAPEPPHHAPSP